MHGKTTRHKNIFVSHIPYLGIPMVIALYAVGGVLVINFCNGSQQQPLAHAIRGWLRHFLAAFGVFK